MAHNTRKYNNNWLTHQPEKCKP